MSKGRKSKVSYSDIKMRTPSTSGDLDIDYLEGGLSYAAKGRAKFSDKEANEFKHLINRVTNNPSELKLDEIVEITEEAIEEFNKNNESFIDVESRQVFQEILDEIFKNNNVSNRVPNRINPLPQNGNSALNDSNNNKHQIKKPVSVKKESISSEVKSFAEKMKVIITNNEISFNNEEFNELIDKIKHFIKSLNKSEVAVVIEVVTGAVAKANTFSNEKNKQFLPMLEKIVEEVSNNNEIKNYLETAMKFSSPIAKYKEIMQLFGQGKVKFSNEELKAFIDLIALITLNPNDDELKEIIQITEDTVAKFWSKTFYDYKVEENKNLLPYLEKILGELFKNEQIKKYGEARIGQVFPEEKIDHINKTISNNYLEIVNKGIKTKSNCNPYAGHGKDGKYIHFGAAKHFVDLVRESPELLYYTLRKPIKGTEKTYFISWLVKNCPEALLELKYIWNEAEESDSEIPDSNGNGMVETDNDGMVEADNEYKLKLVNERIDIFNDIDQLYYAIDGCFDAWGKLPKNQQKLWLGGTFGNILNPNIA